MSAVCAYTEWDPLEEVMVGRALNARIARRDLSLFAVEYRHVGSIENIPSGPYPARVIEETEEDLERLVEAFESLSIKVRRPDVFDHSKAYSTPDWASDGQFNYCPRDLFLVVGDMIIESPMTLRARQYETLSFKRMLIDYMNSGAKWVSAPRPRLAEEAYNFDPKDRAIGEIEPVFDAANIVRLGRDILYSVSDTGNLIGARWLQNLLGAEYRVHAVDNLYKGSHIDTTLTLVKPGVVVVSAERVSSKNLPAIFRKWDVIYIDKVVDIGYTNIPYASEWIGINFMMVNPELAIIDKHQTQLRQELEKRGVDVMPMELRHARTVGGGFHCVTLDVRRRGTLESYVDDHN
jgi:N-dimethylarginine dimethylaminohydrolase